MRTLLRRSSADGWSSTKAARATSAATRAATCSGPRCNLQAHGDPGKRATCKRGPFRGWSAGGLLQAAKASSSP
eukprot:5740443-Alexandrium_andersonii.AAC.1